MSAYVMEKAMKIDHKKHEIVMTNEFSKRAGEFGSKEATYLQRMASTYAGYEIRVRSCKSSTQERYNGLNFDRMRWFIGHHIKDTNALAFLEGLIEKAIDPNYTEYGYFNVRTWFLTNYKEQYLALGDSEAIEKMVAYTLAEPETAAQSAEPETATQTAAPLNAAA